MASTSLYEWNYPKQLLHIRLEEQEKKDKEEIEQIIYSPAFLIKRPLLEAIVRAEEKAPVLLIDEIDRSDEEFEAFLLEILSDFQITIPEIGTMKAKKKPMVVVTSNRTREVPEWSDGTRIGYSLHQFNQAYGHRLVSQRTVVVILSDGWDLGGKELLRREMEALARKAHTVIWLNPLAGDPDYQPVCQGMRIALSYVDYFLPADSLQSLKQVGRLLSRVMIH